MIKALPEAGTGKGGGQREMRAKGHRGPLRWKSVEVVPANSCCVSRAPDWTHAPLGRNSSSRAPDRERERDRKRDERRGEGSGNAGNEVEMSTLSLTLYLTRTAVQVRDRNGSKPQCKQSFCNLQVHTSRPQLLPRVSIIANKMFAAHYKNLVTIQLRLIGGVLPNEIKTMKSNFSEHAVQTRSLF